MRRLIIGLIAAVCVTSACNRPNTASSLTAEPRPNGPAAAPAAGSPTAVAGTVGAAERAPATVAVAVREVTLPAGTRLPIVLDTTVGSETSRVEEAVHAHLSRPVVVGGVTVLPAGSRVTGIVTNATQSAKVKGRAHVAMQFDTLVPQGGDERYRIRTAPVGRTAPATKKKDALKIGGPAAGGAIVGGLLGGKKGALIGTAAGGGAGTAVVLSTRGKEVQMSKGAPLTLRLSEALVVRVRG